MTFLGRLLPLLLLFLAGEVALAARRMLRDVLLRAAEVVAVLIVEEAASGEGEVIAWGGDWGEVGV